MMRMTVRKLRAYHRQVDRLRALRQLEVADAIRYGFHGSKEQYTEFRDDLVRRVKGEEVRKILISNNEELQRFMRGM